MTTEKHPERAPALAVDRSRFSPATAVAVSTSPARSSAEEGTTTLIELAEAVFPNSRAMTREERRAFDASAWSDLEPVEITPAPSVSQTGGRTPMETVLEATEAFVRHIITDVFGQATTDRQVRDTATRVLANFPAFMGSRSAASPPEGAAGEPSIAILLAKREAHAEALTVTGVCDRREAERRAVAYYPLPAERRT